ncbi:PQQ-dependent sugar dehydrogenase [Litoreibacter janthinus]|uniref:Glucose/arabinose dehydrogenase, beta-propeller fold n=1 Tax=Litoreibacter janthinus TaxID=670154 RepID=A0A1I6H6S5_9RHOB|nr:PQQ-dependent sugar dehydrogenase [Litoreibacter janthinus]SFR50122.1 Glucose/arabinose dehydrogenase, beta-propeller fold [Litoreibacter janthinus]
MTLKITLIAAILALGLPAHALDSSLGQLTIKKLADGFDEPWSVESLPDGGILVSERGGALTHLRADGSRVAVKGVPKVVDRGQGGLLDIMIPRDFTRSREVYLSYANRNGDNYGTALGRGKLSPDGTALTGFKRIFQQARGSSDAKHFGSRMVEARDGTIFLTIGERGERPKAQDLSNHNGTVVRLRRSGVVPPDNPFIGMPGAEPEIYSYGHRNPQGAALDLNGNLYVVEHGARGGDEVNAIKAGGNYGWPVISYGRHYSGLKIGEGTSKPGMEQPAHYWDPSIAPSGMMIYSGKLWPQWKGDIFVGSLKFDMISRLDGKTFAEERLEAPETGRVRDVIEGPNGQIWFLSVIDGALYEITP